MTPDAHCIFEYQYRDAGNYKVSASILLTGKVEASDRDLIRDKLEGREFFIPEQVGLRSLQKKFVQYSQVPTSDDHVWHEFVELRDATQDDLINEKIGSKRGLLEAFDNVSRWDERASPIFEQIMHHWIGSRIARLTG